MDLGFYGAIRAVSPVGGSSGHQREPPDPRRPVAREEGDLAFRPRCPQGARGDVAAPASLPGGGHEEWQVVEGGEDYDNAKSSTQAQAGWDMSLARGWRGTWGLLRAGSGASTSQAGS